MASAVRKGKGDLAFTIFGTIPGWTEIRTTTRTGRPGIASFRNCNLAFKGCKRALD